MTWNNLEVSLLSLALLLGIAAATVLAFGKRNIPGVIEKISLYKLSDFWTKEKNRKIFLTDKIHIAELSKLWRDEQKITEKESPDPELKNQRATGFMDKYINHGSWFARAPLQKKVCTLLLEILDRDGHCPSVVNVGNDVEATWDANTYQILAQTSLLDHSLNVTEQAISLMEKSNSWHVIPDIMVAALGHDLGKLESLRGTLYSTGEHPLAAGQLLSSIKEFDALPKKQEILRAVKLHHKIPDGLLGKTLKKADQQARQQELEEVVSRRENVTEKSGDMGSDLEVTDQFTPQDSENSSKGTWKAQSDIYDEKGEANTNQDIEVPQLMDISAWFDARDFLDGLKLYINKMFGRRFLAFSMADGHVYFQAKVLEEVARKQAQQAGCMEIATMAQKDPAMRRVLLTIVQQLRAEEDIIARGLIKDNFFGGYFTVTKKIGKTIKGFYTPFHAEAFGSISEMECSKSEILRNIASVTPYLNNEDVM